MINRREPNHRIIRKCSHWWGRALPLVINYLKPFISMSSSFFVYWKTNHLSATSKQHIKEDIPTVVVTMLNLFDWQESISNHTKQFTWPSSNESGGFHMSYTPDSRREAKIITWQNISALSCCNHLTQWPHWTLSV